MVFHLCGPQGCPTPGCFPVPQCDVWWLQEPTAPLGRVHGGGYEGWVPLWDCPGGLWALQL